VLKGCDHNKQIGPSNPLTPRSDIEYGVFDAHQTGLLLTYREVTAGNSAALWGSNANKIRENG